MTLASVVLLCFLLYALGMFAFGRGQAGPEPDEHTATDTDRLLFVFVLPCLDEELVIGASLERLLALPDRNWVALVVDDGSDDATADIVERYTDPRIRLLRRVPPLARQGKGEALNAAYRHIRTVLARTPAFSGYGADDIVLVVVDADGRVRSDALSVVAPMFRPPDVGAVQIAVRIHNAGSGLLARLQDIEFVTYTEIFQRARSRIGSAGLGGNGQFTRLSALETLGDSPWNRCLTEDLDLAVRLVSQGWRTRFTPRTHVSQQGLTRLRPFLRQRTRWFQGHLQCAAGIPRILRAQLAVPIATDLLITLTLPLLVLLTTLSVVAFYVGGIALVTGDGASTALQALTANHGLALIIWCLVSFGVAPVCAYVYARADERTGFLRSVAYAFLFIFYCYHWLPVGWLAVGRQLLRRSAWTKTRRLPEQPQPDAETVG
ncbi:glycosyltransferase [Streptomyces piniterrae]|uniref:Glycosyltransferase n=1 Tax=Streptomyces piniterrae TaxID=2571125 RepID=A0A4U0NW04_9ACTN|nr:glycosyltransferase [Streptomyces piniterrae]TJZ58925.1 glycosyltransferase [Streptomyces piniterrae]